MVGKDEIHNYMQNLMEQLPFEILESTVHKNPHPEDEKFTNVFNNLVNRGIAFVNSRYQLIGLPSDNHAIEIFSRDFNAQPEKLSKAGITGRELRDIFAIHEISHVLGIVGQYASGTSFTGNETYTIAQETAHLRAATGGETTNAMKLRFDWTALTTLASAIFMDECLEYQFTPSAVSLVNVKLNQNPKLWRHEKLRFDSAFAGDVLDLEDNTRPFATVRKALANRLPMEVGVDYSLGDVSFMMKLRDAALDAEQEFKKLGHDRLASPNRDYEPFQAALIVRQLTRAIDGVMQYADGFYPASSRRESSSLAVSAPA